MQQVFGLMNTLLKNDEQTGKKRLQIRQYKVVPLSQRSGVLEWCDNTMPIGEFLIGPDHRYNRVSCPIKKIILSNIFISRSGAHSYYHPSDLKAAQCRKKLTDVQKSGENVAKVGGSTVSIFD